MNARFVSEFQRLYLNADAPHPAMGTRLGLLGSEGRVRCMVLSLSRPADWPALSAVWRGVQTDFELPAPAIAVNGADAYELWFSLAEAVPLEQAHAFLTGLCRRYLADVKSHRLELKPSANSSPATATTPLIPAIQGDTGLWSAFVAPDLAAVFGEEPALDLPPGLEAQAELLATEPGEASVVPVVPVVPAVASPGAGASRPMAPDPGSAAAERHEDARRFLQGVMNDEAVPMALRIEAAKALLAC
jgi:hypothetical protein